MGLAIFGYCKHNALRFRWTWTEHDRRHAFIELLKVWAICELNSKSPRHSHLPVSWSTHVISYKNAQICLLFFELNWKLSFVCGLCIACSTEYGAEMARSPLPFEFIINAWFLCTDIHILVIRFAMIKINAIDLWLKWMYLSYCQSEWIII